MGVRQKIEKNPENLNGNKERHSLSIQTYESWVKPKAPKHRIKSALTQ